MVSLLKMFMKKIADIQPIKVCRHPGHNPPSMIYLEPGIYEHQCPGCKKTQQVIITAKPMLSAKK